MPYHVIPGSLEVKDGHIVAGVHTGASEWQIENLRYIKTPLPENPEPGKTVLDLLGEVYEATEGCLAKDDFRPKA